MEIHLNPITLQAHAPLLLYETKPEPCLSYPSILRCCRLRTKWTNYMLMMALSAHIHMRIYVNADDFDDEMDAGNSRMMHPIMW